MIPTPGRGLALTVAAITFAGALLLAGVPGAVLLALTPGLLCLAMASAVGHGDSNGDRLAGRGAGRRSRQGAIAYPPGVFKR